MDDSHLCWSHGVGAVRVAKEPRKAMQAGKGMAWEGQCLEAQAEFKVSVLEKVLLNCFSSSVPPD